MEERESADCSGAPAAAADQHQRSQNLLFQSLSQSLLKLVLETVKTCENREKLRRAREIKKKTTKKKRNEGGAGGGYSGLEQGEES